MPVTSARRWRLVREGYILIMYWVLLLVRTACSAGVTLYFVSSSCTPFDLSALLASSSFTNSARALTVTRFSAIELPSDALVLDYSYDPVVSLSLPRNQTLVMWPWAALGRHKLRDWDYQAEFTEYVKAMNMTDVVEITDLDSGTLGNSYPEVYKHSLFVPKNASYALMQEFVRHLVKPSGRVFYAIWLQPQSALYLLQALQEKKLNKAGLVFLLSESASFYQALCEHCGGLMSTGVLTVRPAVSAHARNLSESQASTIEAISDWYSSGGTSLSSLKRAVDTTLVLVNIVNSRSKIVATSPGSMKTLNATFPGGVTFIPKAQRLSIPVSVNYMFYTPGSDVPTPGPTMRGFAVAFEEKHNSTTLLEGFDLSVQPVDLKSYFLVDSVVREFVSRNRHRLGLMHFPIPTSTLIKVVYSAFRALNITIPMSCIFTDVALTKPQDYPLLLGVLTDSEYYAIVTFRIIQHFGWRRLATIYGQGGDAEDVYVYMMKYISMFDITFTNSESSRCLKENLLNGTTAELNATIKEIMNSPARIIMLNHPDTGYILEAMFDLGIRNDYLIICYLGPTKTSLNEVKPNIAKRVAVGQGALIISPRPFIGTTGQRVYRELWAKDGGDIFEYSCFFYDAGMLYLYATDYMINQGLDYEDAYEIVKAMRGTHFAGCGGTVYLANNRNTKPEAEFAVRNFRYFQKNDSIVLEDVLYFNPFSAILLKDVSPILWPDGTYNYWNDTLDLPCPFRDSEVQTSTLGIAISGCVSVGIVLLAVAGSVCSWRQWKTVNYGVLATREELSWEDMVQMAAVPLEAVQVAVVGLESTALNSRMTSAAALTNLHFSIFIGASGEIFWRMLNLIFGIVGIYVIVCVLVLTGLERRIEWIPLLPFLLLFIKLVLPAMSMLLFIPVASSLSQVFQCQEAAGGSLSSSFMDRDCNTWCWQDSHLLFAVGAAIALFLFIPLLVITKPWWQEESKALHIKLHPISHVFKSVFQALLVAIRNALKENYENIHAGCYLFILMVHIAFMTKFPLYNYPRYRSHRVNMWSTIAMVITLIFSILTLTTRLLPSSRTVCLYLFYITTGLLLLVGLLLQRFMSRFHSRLYRKKMDQSKLFKFAFTFGRRARSYLTEHYREPFPSQPGTIVMQGVSTATKA